jgi:dihydroorotate dehydrogenase (fumarate)
VDIGCLQFFPLGCGITIHEKSSVAGDIQLDRCWGVFGLPENQRTRKPSTMNLRTTYMGLRLASPIVVSACPLSADVDNIVQMEEAGAGAVVLFSLFEEQIQGGMAAHRPSEQPTTIIQPKGIDYFPDKDSYHVGMVQYLEIIREAKERVGIPIIASLNGTTNKGWIEYSKQMEEAGADGLEINVFYIPADPELDGRQVEQRYLDIVRTIKSHVSIPVAIKLNPYFSAMANMAKQLREAGADGLVLFNRFYQPDFDIRELRVLSNLEYSHANEIRLPLLWIAAIYGRLDVSIAATTGVQGAREVIKYLLAGADVAMTASALYKYGIDYIKTMTGELEQWMKSFPFESVAEFKGILSQRNISDPTAYERANYIRILKNLK